ncbi:MAG TPA: extracellular solute-binding protein [Gaiellaceae bacterium]|jgi:maltose-binding protein MalE|nr:extracellular solute-binding protein [Gaiellaceae bacterium]
MKSTWRITALVAALAASALAAVAGTASAAPAAGASASATTIRIWADGNRKAAVEKVAGAWGRSRGVTVDVVLKEFGDIRNDLSKVQADTAPDVIVGAHDWTGELAAGGLVVPITPRKTVAAQFPGYTLDAFSYGTGVKRLYGAPVAVENIGLVVNTRLAHVPTSFADFEKQALAFKKKNSANIAVAVPQGANGDAYHMYPFFSGLGGYIFGRTARGTLNPKDVGVANPRFLANAPMIDRWNKEGLINSKIDYDTAKNAFLKKRAAFWITGPWESNTLKDSGLRYKIVQLPRIKYRSAPFLGVQGFMVTKFAAGHGVASLAKDLVGSYMMGTGAQLTLAAANGRYPANVNAGKRVTDGVLKQFGAASTGGVPMPNIPQMASVWSELAGAWVKSTKGTGATRARIAFTVAARNIKNKIG